MNAKKVLLFGTFDILHPGHLDMFRQAREFGDHITVVIARDKTVRDVKGRFPLMSEKERLDSVSGSGIVDSVILGSEYDKYSVIKELDPDIICLGYDQSVSVQGL